ncbi:DUF1631 domain-containing protein [Oceanicoccus sagamiensis]|uniref:Thymidine phosphorylase n=1 Tax=Oceanicoccus sagamiensis TaxID=716816 RepID=A0A1X9NHZ3_9GAMM|nr:DUF1631 domain-containing protein [Oceanicoccus sagamiensis]ARN74527.1 hypothetical protein BST96_10585 [Oceanicoccus sagamiensis]
MKKDSDHIQAAPDNSSSAEIPVLLRQIKDNSTSILLAHLENLFSSCDDLFFDLSSRAATNSEQNLYFESMREVRLKKHGVMASFKGEIEAGFHQIATSAKTSALSSGLNTMANSDHNSLSLVQNDILEQDVAIASMVSKAQVNCQESLYHLNLRFDYLMPNTTINDQNNPMDPQQICHYFADACKMLDLNIKARIILFKQFDRLLVSKLATVYSSANNLLIEAGVLPNTRGYAKNNAQQNQGQSDRATSTATNSQQSVEFDFAELSNLLTSVRQQSPEIIESLIPNYTAYSSNAGPTVSNNDLLQLLTTIQQSIVPPPVNQELQLAENLRQVIDSILAEADDAPAKAVQQPDDDVINLVAMFFDFVLDDSNLPMAVQALISRLQIPILKVALNDKTFFNKGSHPARQLINAIAEASIGWDESTQPQRDRLFSLITKITQEINEEYNNNDQIFIDKLNELDKFIQQTEHKSALIEKRTGQAAEGQARTKLARMMAQKVMFEKLEAAALPEKISEFLTEHWLNLLVMSHLKHGDESPEWIDATQLVDDLIWASHAHNDSKSQARYQKIKPDLLNRISEGMTQIAATREAADETIANLESTLDELHSSDQSDVIIRPLSTSQAETLGHIPGSGSKSWQDMTGVERQQARYKQLTYEYIRKAEQLPIQTWLSFEDPKTGKLTRCKLASRIESSDTYVFVNRFGFKALERQRKDFACDMQAGRATILEKGNLFDRAMGNVLDRLNNNQSSSAV